MSLASTWAPWLRHCWHALDRRLRPAEHRQRLRRAHWGNFGTDARPFAAAWLRLIQPTPQPGWVDAQTWTDLEWPAIFARIDTTITIPGRQVLYARLHQLDVDADIREARMAARKALASHADLRDRVQRILAALPRHECGNLCEYLYAKDLQPPPHRAWLLVWSGVGLAAFIALLVGLLPVAAWLAVPGSHRRMCTPASATRTRSPAAKATTLPKWNASLRFSPPAPARAAACW